MSDESRCSRMKADGSGYHFSRCGRPVKAEGLCALHLAGRRRRAENNKRIQEQMEAEARTRDCTRALCRELAVFGVTAIEMGSAVRCNPQELLNVLRAQKGAAA